MASLKKLAQLVFDLTRRDSWLGGKGWYDDHGASWPETLLYPSERVGQHYWTLSPEVTLGGHQVRVFVHSENSDSHLVVVFVDGKKKHPGGAYRRHDILWLWLPSALQPWSTRIAAQERADGGLSGPVDRRDLLIAEASQRLQAESSKGALSLPDKERP